MSTAEIRPIEEQIASLPARPGVYLMKDAAGKVIYVGKAANLRSRVRSYFREKGDQRFSVRFLRGRVATVETVVTDTDKEALLLENLFIKKHKPRYNIQLRDDKTYISLRLDTTHEWPRLQRVRKRRPGDKALHFGPFASSAAVKETMRFLQRLFPLRSCPDTVLRNRSRPCILHQIGRCSAPCVGLADPEEYQRDVEQTIRFLNGRREDVLALLREKMWEYSESLEFEKAAAARDRLWALEATVEKERVAGHRLFDRDVLGLARGSGRALVMVLAFRGGNLDETRPLEFRDFGHPDGQLLDEFLGQYYDGSRPIPRDILLPEAPENPELLREALAEIRGGAVRLAVPQRGEKRRLLELAHKNAALELEKRLAGEQSRAQVMEDLRRGLRLAEVPRRIECFDISNLHGSFTVGSMTCFVDGEPDKSQYRRFKVRGVPGQDDFAAMREVLTRRYGRVLREGGELPDLIVIDGGKGQLNIAVKVLQELGLLGKVPVCGLAKARLRASKQGVRTKIRTEERVFLPNRKLPVVFNRSDPALFILTRIRDEAHRFGVAYHRKLRSASALRSGLEELPGVGPRRRVALLRHFGSLARLRQATAEEIAAVPGIPESLAGEIQRFLKRDDRNEGSADDSDTAGADTGE